MFSSVETGHHNTDRRDQSNAPEDAAIQTKSLSRKFGQLTAVDRIDLVVKRGQIFGLLGPNGAGKSTTIKMLTTLLDPTAGSAKVAGFDIARQPAEVRRRIGYVPQMVSADGALTGRENLVLSAKLHRMPAAERSTCIAEALRFMELEESACTLVKTYSGGMIRRLELAQAMLHHPVVLFLDEPTIGLDPVARRIVWDRLRDLKRDYSAIFSTFSLIIACIVKTRERFMGIGQVLTMPLFFASNAIYPLELMPNWLLVVAKINPLTCLVDALRDLMIRGGHSA